MKRILAIFLGVHLVGCDVRDTHAAPKLSDEVTERIRADNPGMKDACLQKARRGGIEAMPAELEQCFGMTPMRRWRGLWRNDFEGSRFCPPPAQECSYDTPGDRVWLSVWAKLPEDIRQGRFGDLYAVDFVGRRTVHSGRYGHMGMSDHEMVVDRLISIERVPEAEE